MKNPHAGSMRTLTTAYAGLGGDAEWVKVTTRATYYHTLSEEYDVVALLTGGAGHITGTATASCASSTSSRTTTA